MRTTFQPFHAHFQVQVRGIAKNLRVLRKCSNKFDCIIFEMFFLFVTLSQNETNRAIPSAQSRLFDTFNSFLILSTSYLYLIFAFRYF